MSTRAAIGMLVNDEIHTIYCHYDGYPSHVGKILQSFWNDEDRAKTLVYGPQIRNFDHDGVCVRFGDGSVDDHECTSTPCEAIVGYDYLYLFDIPNKQWKCFSREGYVQPLPYLKEVRI